MSILDSIANQSIKSMTSTHTPADKAAAKAAATAAINERSRQLCQLLMFVTIGAPATKALKTSPTKAESIINQDIRNAQVLIESYNPKTPQERKAMITELHDKFPLFAVSNALGHTYADVFRFYKPNTKDVSPDNMYFKSAEFDTDGTPTGEFGDPSDDATPLIRFFCGFLQRKPPSAPHTWRRSPSYDGLAEMTKHGQHPLMGPSGLLTQALRPLRITPICQYRGHKGYRLEIVPDSKLTDYEENEKAQAVLRAERKQKWLSHNKSHTRRHTRTHGTGAGGPPPKS